MTRASTVCTGHQLFRPPTLLVHVGAPQAEVTVVIRNDCPVWSFLGSVVLISVVGWGSGLLVLGFVSLLAGQVSMSVVVAESWPVLVALATDVADVGFVVVFLRGGIMPPPSACRAASPSSGPVLALGNIFFQILLFIPFFYVFIIFQNPLYLLDAFLFSGIHLLLYSLAAKQGFQCGTLRGKSIFLQGQFYFGFDFQES